MTDTSDRLAEIRARLDAATEGPWEATPNGRVLGRPRPEHAGERDVADTILDVDAELIAHAPTDIAALLSLVEQLQGQLDTVRESLEYSAEENARLSASILDCGSDAHAGVFDDPEGVPGDR